MLKSLGLYEWVVFKEVSCLYKEELISISSWMLNTQPVAAETTKKKGGLGTHNGNFMLMRIGTNTLTVSGEIMLLPL